jgi:hypothetical protein
MLRRPFRRDFPASRQNQSDRSAAAVEFRHGRELRFEEEMAVTDFTASFRAMLDEAKAALRAGDASDAERRAKAVSALVRAERDVAEFVAQFAAATTGEDEETRRAELRRRIAQFIVAERPDAPVEVLE